MFKRRVIRMVVGHIFDQLSDETLEMLNEIIDAEIEERVS
jgi:hypothetical protein